MTLSGPETAGIIIVIIVILILCLGAFYSTKHVRQQNTLPDATDPPLPTGSGRPSLSSLLRLKGTNKRTEISDPEHHIRYPSLEHGPGPTLTTLAVPETPAIGTIRAVTATPTASPLCSIWGIIPLAPTCLPTCRTTCARAILWRTC